MSHGENSAILPPGRPFKTQLHGAWPGGVGTTTDTNRNPRGDVGRGGATLDIERGHGVRR